MSTVVVIGAQWGDEGKGKITDFLAEKADVVMRYQGGSNAGHTVEANGNTYKLRLVPSGILYDDAVCIIGNGVVVDPEALLHEIDTLRKQGVKVDSSKLLLSDRAHVVMPYHKVLDSVSEKQRGKGDIGTTGRGIGPCYMDKHERSGIRVCDLMHKDVFEARLRENLEVKNKIIKYVYGGEELSFDDIYNKYIKYAEELRDYVTDTSVAINKYIDDGKEVLFEGAQGTLLDIDHGTYPYVTSSHPISGGVCTGAGVGPGRINEVVGVCKSYTTRVGKGPFTTELFNEEGDSIREKGHEYGTVTGRPRRCGWLDLVIVKTATRLSGLTQIALTKLDTLAGIKTIKLCTGYEFNGKVIDYIPASLEDLALCKPVYEEFDGWSENVSNARTYDELDENAKIYLKRIENFTGVKISIISVGPGRDQTITVK